MLGGAAAYGQHADRVDREGVDVGVTHFCGFCAASDVQKGSGVLLGRDFGEEDAKGRSREGEEGGVIVLCGVPRTRPVPPRWGLSTPSWIRQVG